MKSLRISCQLFLYHTIPSVSTVIDNIGDKSGTIKTGRRISFEYTLISGVNDSSLHAERLAEGLVSGLGKGTPIHVNLIPLNGVSEKSYQRSNPGAVLSFQKRLSELGINATVRRRLGSDINASCGQLRYNGQDSLYTKAEQGI